MAGATAFFVGKKRIFGVITLRTVGILDGPTMVEALMASSGAGRLIFLDRLRGLAVIGMFFVHSTVAWLRPEFGKGHYHHVMMKISGLIAPTFLFLVGISVVLAWKAAEKKGRLEDLRARLIRRGLGIWVAGYLLELLFWSFDHFDGTVRHILRVDILQCIGAGLVVLPLIAPPRRFNVSALVLFFFLPVLGHALFYASFVDHLPIGLAAYVTTSSRLAQFPILPNWAWIALGLFVGGLWVETVGKTRRELLFWGGVVLAAVLLFVGASQLHWYYYHRFIYRFHLRWFARPSRGLVHAMWLKASWVLAIFAISRLIGLVADRIAPDWTAGKPVPWAPAILFGRTSLFAYSVHLGFIYYGVGRRLCRHLSPADQFVGALVIWFVVYWLCVLWIVFRPVFWKKFWAVMDWIRSPQTRPAEGHE